MNEQEQVFISYSSADMDWAVQIKENLNSNGIVCWMANSGGIAPGENYVEEITRALETCPVFLLVLSENAENSPWVSKELGTAISARKRIIPVKISDYQITKFRFQLENIQIFQPGNLAEVTEQLKLVNAVKKALDLREVSADAFVASPGRGTKPAAKKGRRKLPVPVLACLAAAVVLVGGIFLGRGLFSGGGGGDVDCSAVLAAASEAEMADPRFATDGDPLAVGLSSTDGSMKTTTFTVDKDGYYFFEMRLSPVSAAGKFVISSDFPFLKDTSALPESLLKGGSTDERYLCSLAYLAAGAYKLTTNAVRCRPQMVEALPFSDNFTVGTVYYDFSTSDYQRTLNLLEGDTGRIYTYSGTEGEFFRETIPVHDSENSNTLYINHPAGSSVIDTRALMLPEASDEAQELLSAAIEKELTHPAFQTTDANLYGLTSLDGTPQTWTLNIPESGVYFLEMFLSPVTYGESFVFESDMVDFDASGFKDGFFSDNTSKYLATLVQLSAGEHTMTTNSLRCRAMVTPAQSPSGTMWYGNIYYMSFTDSTDYNFAIPKNTTGTYFAYSCAFGSSALYVPSTVTDTSIYFEYVPAGNFILDLRFLQAPAASDEAQKLLSAAIEKEQADGAFHVDGDPTTLGTVSTDGTPQVWSVDITEQGVYYVEMYISPVTYGENFQFETDLFAYDTSLFPSGFFDSTTSTYVGSLKFFYPGHYTVTTNSLRCRPQVTKAQSPGGTLLFGNIYYIIFGETTDYTLTVPEGTTGKYYAYSCISGGPLSSVNSSMTGNTILFDDIPAGNFILDLRLMSAPT